MAGINWVDIVIIVCLLIGMAIGYQQGVIRQLIGLVVLYIALILATQFFRVLSQWLAGLLRVPPNTLSNMIAFFVIFLLALTLINFLAQDAYKSTRIRLMPFIDHTAGLILGVLSMWIILSVSIGVITFAVGAEGWLQAETTRALIENGVKSSRLAQLTEATLPTIIAAIQPWLPSGLPALFNF